MKSSIVFVLSLLLSCCAIADNSISPNRQQYLNNLLIQDCGSCHGLTMKGGLGPALLPDSLKGKPAAFITATILDGRPGTAMPGWRALLSDEEAAWLTSKLLSGNL
ncbi:MAG: cytochrome c [Gammaproteobacteria bacterium]|nr:cytochrome c [Gammaproteobacteria bacterium]